MDRRGAELKYPDLGQPRSCLPSDRAAPAAHSRAADAAVSPPHGELLEPGKHLRVESGTLCAVLLLHPLAEVGRSLASPLGVQAEIVSKARRPG